MKRDNGYYWVKIIDDWCIAHYSTNGIDEAWWLAGFFKSLPTNYFKEINETRILSPDEQLK